MSNPKHGSGKSGAKSSAGPSASDDLWGNRSRSGPDACFSDCPGCSATIDAIVNAGALFMVGRTSDGGALCITVKHGDRFWRTYASKQDELDAVLAQAFDRFADR